MPQMEQLFTKLGNNSCLGAHTLLSILPSSLQYTEDKVRPKPRTKSFLLYLHCILCFISLTL
jgi:hypothetical protein